MPETGQAAVRGVPKLDIMTALAAVTIRNHGTRRIQAEAAARRIFAAPVETACSTASPSIEGN